MLGVVGRAWRVWRDKARLVAPIWNYPPGFLLTPYLRFPELREVMQAGGPELQPYQGMAEVWDKYGSAQLPNYPSFLAALTRRRGIALQSVLDLACGTGTLMSRLTRVAEDVVGLDTSEPMLAVARGRHGSLPGVGFARGDFRDFALGRQFDAAVCASNSLNYVADRDELGQVFTSVGKHLRPGGLFVFDTYPDRGMRYLSDQYVHSQGDGWRLAIHFSYDARRRKETSRVLLPNGIETHRRIPIDPADVVAAAEGSGLDVEDYFSSALLPRGWGHGLYYFFVLTKRG
jgi:SAM-dependent methyltransferase